MSARDRPAWLVLCLPVTKRFEGLAKRVGSLVYPYLDRLAKPPRWTRGYGRTYGITEASPPLTAEQADDELAQGLSEYSLQVLRLAPRLVERPECLAAVVDWAWNCGIGAFRASRLRRAINDGRWADASEFIKKPDTAGGVVYNGLLLRRALNSQLFARGICRR